MPNDEHVALLVQGATAWNEWRAKFDGTLDLSRAGLRGLDLTGFDLSRAIFAVPISEAQHSATRICQVPILRARTPSKLYSTTPILPGSF